MTVSLRPWRAEDIPALARYADDPRIAANLRDAFPSPYTRADAQWFVEDCMARDENDVLFRAIMADGQMAGSISVVRGADVYRQSGELGYWLAVPFWGQGIMTAAVEQICREAFDSLGLVRIFAEVFACNTASRRVLEKAGVQLEGILQKSVTKNGQLYDSCLYGLVRQRGEEGRET